jgi:uncharacterized protein YkwD
MHRWRIVAVGCVSAWALLACGGGGGGDSSATASTTPPATIIPTDPGAPAPTNNIAVDGRNWFNFRRTQLGIPTVAQNVLIDIAAQGHSDYQRINNTVTHDQTPGKQGFTGASLKDRLNNAGYTIPASGFAYGEVISAANSNSGFYLSEELITAIYHRFIIFQPMFKELGTGFATSSSGYTYFTADFAARDGWGPGIADGTVVVWPFDGQTQVVPNFFSNSEEPDPVPETNEVGYPISVEGNLDQVLSVTRFSVRPRGGSDLSVKTLQPGSNEETPTYAAAIIPFEPLKSATTYDVTFVGTATNRYTSASFPVSRTWSFTTR